MCSQLDQRLENACLLLETLSQQTGPALRAHLPVLLRLLAAMFASPLAAPRVTHLFLQLRNTAFLLQGNSYFGE